MRRPKLSSWLSAIVLLLISSFLVGCPKSRAPRVEVGGAKAGGQKEPEAVLPDDPQAIEMIKQVGGRSTVDDNGNVTSVDFTALAISDEQVPLLAGLPKMRKLRLWGAKITDGVFDDLVKFKSVVDVGLENTEITDAGLQNLSQMPQLRSVYLRRNSYLTDESFKVFPQLPKLTAIQFIYHRITDKALEEIKDLENVRVLDVRGCVELSDDGFLQLSKLKNLEQVKMRTAGFTDKGMALFQGTPKLKVLVLEDTPITAAGLASIKGAKNLVQLDLLRTRIDDAALENLSNLPKLQKLTLRDNPPINGEGLTFLANSKELTSLNISETNMNDAGLVNLEAYSKLASLDLWNTQISDAGMASVAKLKGLTALTIDETEISDAGIAHLEGSKLKKLFMKQIPVTDAVIESLKKIKTLESIDLTNCIQITPEGMSALKEAFPNADIFGGY